MPSAQAGKVENGVRRHKLWWEKTKRAHAKQKQQWRQQHKSSCFPQWQRILGNSGKLVYKQPIKFVNDFPIFNGGENMPSEELFWLAQQPFSGILPLLLLFCCLHYSSKKKSKVQTAKKKANASDACNPKWMNMHKKPECVRAIAIMRRSFASKNRGKAEAEAELEEER